MICFKSCGVLSSRACRLPNVPQLPHRLTLQSAVHRRCHDERMKPQAHVKEPQVAQLLQPSLLAITMLVGLSSPAHALEIQAEPANALSLPTWAIHVSSVVEWVTAMGLFWKYAEVTGNQKWKGMTWGMLPSLGSAMCACTWHLFYNAPSLEFLVALQAFLTVVGNTTCLLAAYRIYDASQKEKPAV